MIDDQGNLKRSGVSLVKDVGVGDVRVHGTLDFISDPSGPVASIKNAEIRGRSLHGVDSMEVSGESSLNGGVNIGGDLFVDGAVTVSGTVFGGGPYVIVSDVRLKKNIK